MTIKTTLSLRRIGFALSLSLAQLFLFNTSSHAQNVPNGEHRKPLYEKTRCIECTFVGCVTLKQTITQVSDMVTGASRVEEGPIQILTYDFPCACSKGPVIEEWKDERGRSPYPWNRINGVTVNDNVPSVRGFTSDGPYNPFPGLKLKAFSYEDVFALSNEELLRLLDKDWPAKYPKDLGNGLKRDVPALGCGTAPAGFLGMGTNAEDLEKLLKKLKAMAASGGSTDDLDNWEKRFRGVMKDLEYGKEFTLPEGVFDFGREDGIRYYGDCRWDFVFWHDIANNVDIKETHEEPPVTDGLPPTGYDDLNVWRHCYPITNIVVTRLNNGMMTSNTSYHMQRDIRVDLTQEAPGTIVNLTVVLFDGTVVNRKVLIH